MQTDAAHQLMVRSVFTECGIPIEDPLISPEFRILKDLKRIGRTLCLTHNNFPAAPHCRSANNVEEIPVKTEDDSLKRRQFRSRL